MLGMADEAEPGARESGSRGHGDGDEHEIATGEVREHRELLRVSERETRNPGSQVPGVPVHQTLTGEYPCVVGPRMFLMRSRFSVMT